MEPAVRWWYQVANVGSHIYFLGSRTRYSDIAGSSLLQQQFGCLDNRLGVKAGAHCAIVKGIVDRNKCHPLMVRHVGAHDRNRLTFGKARWCVIQSLVKSVCATTACMSKTRIIFCSRLWIYHRSQRGGVWCNDRVFAETALKPQSGNAEVRVLIRELKIAHIVGGF